jgi:general secretion pathway protein M
MRSRAATAAFSVVVLLAVLAAMGFIAAAPFVRLNWLEQTIAHNQEELLQLRKEIAREGALRKENSELAAVGEDASLMLLQGETTGIAGANLQKLMSGLVLQHGGTASSIQILPTKEDGNLVRIPISLSISVGIDGLRDILYGLETGTPLLFIDDITIKSESADFGTPDPHYLGPLDVTLQVSGYALRNEAS